MKYVIYQLNCGSAQYVGSSNHYKRRYLQHLKSLKENKHPNDALQQNFNKGHKLKGKTLTEFNTLFRYQVLSKEQRYINRYSNCNEAIASKIVKYSKKEFCYDMIDFIVNHWKLISAIIVTILIVGYGMTQEQATQVIDFIVKMYNGG